MVWSASAQLNLEGTGAQVEIIRLGAGFITPAAAPELKQVQSVYVLSMTSSLDQYVIDRIVAKGQFTVVTDPLKADAIFTDRVGEAFDNKLDDILIPKEEKKKISK